MIKTPKDLLDYEIRIFRNICSSFTNFNKLDEFSKNLLIESLALHTRVLVDFFYCDNKKYSDDIIAQDLLPKSIIWTDLRPELSSVLKDAKGKADKQLAHLSTPRLIYIANNTHGWRVSETSKEINLIIDLFYNARGDYN